VVLAASLAMVVAYARAGAAIFWQAIPQTTSVSGAHAGAYAALGLGAALLVAVSAGAGPLAAYTAAAAHQLYNPGAYVAAVLQQPRAAAVFDIRKEMRERVQAGGSK
jgi:multicomponent K+:H+ antiporter subunit D